MSCNINRIHHWSPIQTEKSQPSCKRIMPETRFNIVFGIIPKVGTSFPALSVYPKVGIDLVSGIIRISVSKAGLGLISFPALSVEGWDFSVCIGDC